MIGDEQLPDDCDWSDQSKGFGGMSSEEAATVALGEQATSQRSLYLRRLETLQKDDPLLPSGLLGPVTVNRED